VQFSEGRRTVQSNYLTRNFIVTRGKISKWTDRHFGFITSTEHPKGIFVHGSAILLQPGQIPLVGQDVEYQADVAPDGRERAINVRLIGNTAPAEPTALERDRQRHREFRDSRDRRQRYETTAMSPRQRAERLWRHGGEDET
jgi:cold shock CspA family protein